LEIWGKSQLIRKRVYWLTDGNIVYDWDEIFWLLFSTNRHIHRKENKIYILFLKGPHNDNDNDIDKDKENENEYFFVFCSNTKMFLCFDDDVFPVSTERKKIERNSDFHFYSTFFSAVWRILWNSQVVQLIFCRKYLLILFSWIPFQEKKSKFFWTQNELIKFVERILIFFDEAEVLFELE
jgi:hypothetical protein